jgi:hypothetical protein
MSKAVRHLRVRRTGLRSKSITLPPEFDATIGDLIIWREEDDCVVLKLVRASDINELAEDAQPVEAASAA